MPTHLKAKWMTELSSKAWKISFYSKRTSFLFIEIYLHAHFMANYTQNWYGPSDKFCSTKVQSEGLGCKRLIVCSKDLAKLRQLFMINWLLNRDTYKAHIICIALRSSQLRDKVLKFMSAHSCWHLRLCCLLDFRECVWSCKNIHQQEP
jgi:hypothetical protein